MRRVRKGGFRRGRGANPRRLEAILTRESGGRTVEVLSVPR